MISTAPSHAAQVRGRFAARAPTWPLWSALWLLAAAAEALALRPVLWDRDAPIAGLDVVFSLVGGAFAACGLMAWRRRPDSRSGVLMTATGFAFFVSPLLSQLDGALAYTTQILLVDVWIFFFVPLLKVWPDEDVAHVVDRVQRGLLAIICAVTVTVIAVRWSRASGPRRRILLPSLAGALALLCFTLLLANDLIAGTRSQTLLWLAACSIITVPAAFLAGLLRSRLARGGLADLVRGLGSARGGELETVLGRALGDPGLTVAYWLPEYDVYADAGGEPVALPSPGGDRAVAPIDRDGRRIAALVYDASLRDDPELLEAVTAAAAITIENERLQAESRARLAELKASRERLVAAGDAERRRLERNLHDGAQQRLVGIALQLRLLQRRLRGDPSAEELVSAASEELTRSLAELRELARGIHPAVLEHGLAPALNALAGRCAVATTVRCETTGRLPEPVELAAYFVASEALANVAKYAHATHATVRVWQAGALAGIEIADDGVGGADDSRGTGLRGLADRVEALDGRLRVVSPPGQGTVVTAELPCAS